ncbi:class I SAM-dependent methyltransferase [Alteromonas stellipolaris]|uniref:Class I SAM-dependent methyltransferase n=1 Tax=Alteromonas stellipolaris TaxID=233316 RepID=A0AAW7Z241_9ALTE|nr:class I SAM-dependent methyltransferase [Alteromonas stellipolaris]MDO6578824.1 class I SAM-dependent methyltransferase [Alteromonas stellipolaris]MDP2536454.1 class I SAM-dependent methyltransferase [Alteromonas stellipolaris]
MSESSEDIKVLISSLQQTLFKRIERQERTNRNLVNQVYTQLESLFWLEKKLLLKNQLPPLRGWATSPDVLLKLHSHIIETKPKCIVEFGSGASTLVIADALRQNGSGKLYSFDDSDEFGSKTQSNLNKEELNSFVNLTVASLVPWSGSHLTTESVTPYWYDATVLDKLDSVDLVWVDGPPGKTCKFSRFPAVPAVIDKLHSSSQVWMDDTIREEETQICEAWSELTKMSLEFFSLEKGLGVLSYSDENNVLGNKPNVAISEPNDSIVSKLDFS